MTNSEYKLQAILRKNLEIAKLHYQNEIKNNIPSIETNNALIKGKYNISKLSEIFNNEKIENKNYSKLDLLEVAYRNMKRRNYNITKFDDKEILEDNINPSEYKSFKKNKNSGGPSCTSLGGCFGCSGEAALVWLLFIAIIIAVALIAIALFSIYKAANWIYRKKIKYTRNELEKQLVGDEKNRDKQFDILAEKFKEQELTNWDLKIYSELREHYGSFNNLKKNKDTIQKMLNNEGKYLDGYNVFIKEMSNNLNIDDKDPVIISKSNINREDKTYIFSTADRNNIWKRAFKLAITQLTSKYEFICVNKGENTINKAALLLRRSDVNNNNFRKKYRNKMLDIEPNSVKSLCLDIYSGFKNYFDYVYLPYNNIVRNSSKNNTDQQILRELSDYWVNICAKEIKACNKNQSC